MKAVILDAEQRSAHVKKVLESHPSSNELLIRVEVLALNPIDSLYVFNPLASTGRIIGSDFTGVMNALGDAVSSLTSELLKPGDRVVGFL